MSTLAHTLAYENNAVVHKFCERYALSFDEASDVFLETKRWLWLVAHAQTDPSAPAPLTVIGFDALAVVDEMWHTFILFTESYSAFCSEYFARFIHHAPATRADREQTAAERTADPDAFAHERLADFRVQARYVGEQLGPEIVRKWFVVYAHEYSLARLDALLIPHSRRV